VTRVRDEQPCGGACWAFSAVGALEGAYFVAFGAPLRELSAQQLVSCTPGTSCLEGGEMSAAFAFMQRNGGLCSEQAYPYAPKPNNTMSACRSGSCRVVPGTALAGFAAVDATEEALRAAVARQPVSVAIEGLQGAFQFYKSGVLTAACGTALDHAVLVTGYGVDSESGADLPYWRLKNDFGLGWGENGYARIARGVAQPGGQCGILLDASVPVLLGDNTYDASYA